MQTSLVAPINYLEPPADHWPRIFRILAVASMVFGAFYALAAVSDFRSTWQLMQLSPAPTSNFLYWGPLISPIIDLVVGVVIVTGSAMLLKRQPYEFLIRSLRFIVVVSVLSTCIGIYKSRDYLSWQYFTYSMGNLGKIVSFPLLVILILLAHRKANPKSPLAVKPKPPVLTRSDDPMSLLR